MTTTFKVVEFYRNNSALNLDSLSLTTTTPGLGSNGTANNSLYNILGFSIVGGYLADVPATITNVSDTVALNNAKTEAKVEEGDVIFEINGISTRHLTLNEVHKQLRSCGNRIFLKIKSDPEYKVKFKELIKDKAKFEKLVNFKSGATILTAANLNGSLMRNASKSYDNNINHSLNGVGAGDEGRNVNSAILNGAGGSVVSHSSTSSNLTTTGVAPSMANSHSNIFEANSVSATSILNSSTSASKLQQQPVVAPVKINNSASLTALSAAGAAGAAPDSEAASITTDVNLTNGGCGNTEAAELENDVGQLVINGHVYDNNSSFQLTTTTMSASYENTNGLTNGLANGMSNTLVSTNQLTSQVLSFQVEIDDTIKKKIDEKLRECSSGDSDSESEHNIYTPKAVDLPSAQRLAKRLYYLDGFKANDVVRHLSKKNDFSQLVADEYLKLFNFESLTLDAALRKFLKQFQLVGDAQEKERVLMYFAKRYVDANNTTFNDVDSCHTLTCALMLLNTDLHDPKIQNKMTLNEFIENLKGLNSGSNYPEVLLESLYSAIKNEPLECACLENDESPYDERNSCSGSGNAGFSMRSNGSNPFLQMPDPQTAKEYKNGWLLRKCCIDADGKKSPFLKRSWKMFYASLRDMVLYLHKDDKVFKNNTFDNITNAIRIHHAYATVASDYKKKQFVFRLKTADWAEYLFQTSNSNELYDWVSCINMVASMFSSPPLPGAISSSKTFQRPLMPVSKTRYTLQEQYEYHKKHLKQLQTDLARLESAAGASLNCINGISHVNTTNSNTTGLVKDEKHFDKDKYNYLHFEIQRYTTYANLLEEKLLNEQSSTNGGLMPQINMINPAFNDVSPHLTYSHGHFTANSTQITGGPVYFNNASITTTTTTTTSANNYNTNGINHIHQYAQPPPPISNHHHLNGGGGGSKVSQNSSISLLNSNMHDSVASKSVPTTPTHLNSSNSNIKNVNFNISPTSVSTGNRNSLTLNDTGTPIINTTPTLNSKKYNTYLD